MGTTWPVSKAASSFSFHVMSCINLCCGEKNGIEKHFETLESDSMLGQTLQKSTIAGSTGSGGFSCAGETGSTVGSSGTTIASVMDSQTRNPLLCFVCDNYYSEPCLLVCYHTFCAKCLQGREAERKITCPLCGVQTALKDGQAHPAPDMLMRHLIELANAENPPCANCDKRDKNNMYFCITCGG